MSELTDLTAAIKNLTGQYQSSTKESANGNSVSSGLIQGVAESAITSSGITNALKNEFSMLAINMEAIFTNLISKITSVLGEINFGGLSEKFKEFNHNFGGEYKKSPQMKDWVPYQQAASIFEITQGNLDAIKNSTGGSGGSGGSNGNAKPKSLAERWGLDKFSNFVNKAALALSGFVAVGLRSTLEGYKLGLAFERMSYQIADALKSPIDFLTRVIGQITAEFNYLNKIPVARSILGWTGGIMIAAGAIKGLVFVFAPLVAGFQALAAALGLTSLALLGYAAIIAAAVIAAPYVYDAAYKAGKESHKWLSDKTDAFQDWMYEKFGIQGGKYNHAKERNDAAKAAGYDNWAEAKKAQDDDKLYQFVNAKPKEEIIKDMMQDRIANPGMSDKEYEDRYFARAREEMNKKKNPEEEHLQPMYQTHFQSLTTLWESMNKAVTEQPGMDKQISLLERIFGVLDNRLPNNENAPHPQGALAN